MATHKLTIYGELPSLNDYTNGQRRNRFVGAKLKKQATFQCEVATRKAMADGFKFPLHSDVICHWYAKDKRKDKDNIAFALKFIFDGMQQAHLIENDNWVQIGNIHHEFNVDKSNPRVEVEIMEETNNE